MSELSAEETKKRDLLLVKSILKGRTKDFAKLVSFYQARVVALGMSFFRNTTDTEDFVQDVFIKAFTNLSTFRGESLFSTWLTRIAYTTAVNSKNRRKEYLPLVDEEMILDRDDNPEAKEIRRATIMSVREAIRELPEKYSVCLELYFFYDMGYEEISKVTDIPLNTIKSNIFRAKSILRGKLGEI